jgi:large subunit ribosomal protein L9
MEVILKQDIKNLGYKDDVVKVRDGYGRNFLIPKGYAIVANVTNMKVLTETTKQRSHREEKLRTSAEATAAALKDVTVKVGAKVGEKGRIFGAVTPIQIAEALKKLGYEVDRRNISLNEEAIKSVGTYTADVRLYKDIAAKVNFEVIEE